MSDDALVREVAQLRTDLAGDIAALRTDLARLVSRDVMDAELGRLADRLSTAERDLGKLETAIAADRAAQAERDKAAKETLAEREKTRKSDGVANRRLVWGIGLTALAGLLVQLLRGTGIVP